MVLKAAAQDWAVSEVEVSYRARNGGRSKVSGSAPWDAQTSLYGPLFTLLSAPLGLVSASVALWTYKAAAGLASIATAVLVADLARRGLNPARAAILVGLNPVLLVYAVSGAHYDLLAIMLVACALRSWGAGRESAAVAAAGWAFLALIASLASLAPWYLVWLVPLAALGRDCALVLAVVLATLYLILVHLPALGGQPWLSAAI